MKNKIFGYSTVFLISALLLTPAQLLAQSNSKKIQLLFSSATHGYLDECG